MPNQISPSSVVMNPYVIVNQTRGREVHLPGFRPTSKANNALFATEDDDTSVASGRYYKSKHNLPWALDIPEQVPYSQENTDLVLGYKKLAPWAQSNGNAFPDWYKALPGYRDNSKLYIR